MNVRVSERGGVFDGWTICVVLTDEHESVASRRSVISWVDGLSADLSSPAGVPHQKWRSPADM